MDKNDVNGGFSLIKRVLFRTYPGVLSTMAAHPLYLKNKGFFDTIIEAVHI